MKAFVVLTDKNHVVDIGVYFREAKDVVAYLTFGLKVR